MLQVTMGVPPDANLKTQIPGCPNTDPVAFRYCQSRAGEMDFSHLTLTVGRHGKVMGTQNKRDFLPRKTRGSWRRQFWGCILKNEKILTWYRFKLGRFLRTDEGIKLLQAGGELVLLIFV